MFIFVKKYTKANGQMKTRALIAGKYYMYIQMEIAPT